MSNFIYLGNYYLLGLGDKKLYIDLDKYCFFFNNNIYIESPIIIIGSKKYQLYIDYNYDNYRLLISGQLSDIFDNKKEFLLSKFKYNLKKFESSIDDDITTSFYISDNNIYFFDKNDNTYKPDKKLFKHTSSLKMIKNNSINDYHIIKKNLIIYTKKGVDVIYEKSSSSSPKERILVEFKSPPPKERILVEFKLRSTSSEKRIKNATTLLQAVVKRRIEKDKLKNKKIATTLLQAFMKRNKPMKDLKNNFRKNDIQKLDDEIKQKEEKLYNLETKIKRIEYNQATDTQHWGRYNKEISNTKLLSIKQYLKELNNFLPIKESLLIDNKYKLDYNILKLLNINSIKLYSLNKIIYTSNFIIFNCILHYNIDKNKKYIIYENKEEKIIQTENLPDFTYIYDKYMDKLYVINNGFIFGTNDDYHPKIQQIWVNTI